MTKLQLQYTHSLEEKRAFRLRTTSFSVQMKSRKKKNKIKGGQEQTRNSGAVHIRAKVWDSVGKTYYSWTALPAAWQS